MTKETLTSNRNDFRNRCKVTKINSGKIDQKQQNELDNYRRLQARRVEVVEEAEAIKVVNQQAARAAGMSEICSILLCRKTRLDCGKARAGCDRPSSNRIRCTAEKQSVGALQGATAGGAAARAAHGVRGACGLASGGALAGATRGGAGPRPPKPRPGLC